MALVPSMTWIVLLYLEMGGSKQKEAKGLYICTTSDEVTIIIIIIIIIIIQKQ